MIFDGWFLNEKASCGTKGMFSFRVVHENTVIMTTAIWVNYDSAEKVKAQVLPLYLCSIYLPHALSQNSIKGETTKFTVES